MMVWVYAGNKLLEPVNIKNNVKTVRYTHTNTFGAVFHCGISNGFT